MTTAQWEVEWAVRKKGKMHCMIGENVVNLIYPKRCPLCGSVRPYGDQWVCGKCMKNVKWIRDPVCMCCGKSLEGDEQEYCRDCQGIPKHFAKGFPVFRYEGAIKESLYDFKYGNQREYAKFYADCIVSKYGRELKRLVLNGIVPVPVHKKKRRMRGYNQAELIANELEMLLGIPVYPDYLVRVIETNPQKELNDKERMKNTKRAFKIGENDVKLEKVLLVDDIYTSGATIEACTNELLQTGVKEVYYTSVAIGRGYS